MNRSYGYRPSVGFLRSGLQFAVSPRFLSLRGEMSVFDHLRVRRSVRPAVAVLVLASGGVALAAAANPAGAAATLAAVAGAVTCTTTGTTACQSYTNTSSGIAVSGTSAKGTGVRASSTSNFGVKSTSSTADAIFGQVTSSSSSDDVAGVVGTSPNGYGVYGYTQNGGYGVFGNGPKIGVLGETTVTSNSATGVVGEATGSATGLYGSSDSGIGTNTFTTTGTALMAQALESGYGINALTVSGVGILGHSDNGNAIVGTSDAGEGGDFQGSSIGLVGRAPASNGYPLVLTDQSNNDVFYVSGAGNVYYHGSLHTFARTKSGATVSEFSARSSAPTVEDTGTAELVGGVAKVRLDPAFAATIDTGSPYRVFVTPDGDTRGLFIASKTTEGFVVRETQGGRSNLAFDYRIVAASIGEGGQRMTMVTAAHDPHTVVPERPKMRAPRLKFAAK